MDVLHYPADPRPARWHQPVLALGNFDGMHRGHAKIVERVNRGAIERGGTAVAMTFDPHPPRVVRPDKAPPLLMTLPQKLEALARAGIHGTTIVEFTPELSRWDPATFVTRVLIDWLRVSEVWVGANFLFGRDRSGNFSILRVLGARHGFRAEKIDPVRYKEFVVSSTRVRRLVGEGRVDEAAALLGHHYVIDGTVVEGARRGRAIGVPTANLCTENELVPPNGVYATLVTVQGVVHPSVTNVGVRPTFGEASSAAVIETHLIGFAGELYGSRLRLAFVQRLRDERRFDGVEALRAQIASDCARARALFDRISL
ncbi:MAG: bifunctional riboflavin kinase/FAD synthetase, partial [Acidobacteria bacterium]|nr:bifunctional riboflavin kinase/FAD synthetase [Acidobacteriota bacterium]MBI3261634.1 bifunctional riboflavin kinase/FAD synthetase [Acidobacteriota bacterium]